MCGGYKIGINLKVGMSLIVDKINIFTLSNKSHRMVGYRIEIIDILYPNNGI